MNPCCNSLESDDIRAGKRFSEVLVSLVCIFYTMPCLVILLKTFFQSCAQLLEFIKNTGSSVSKN